MPAISPRRFVRLIVFCILTLLGMSPHSDAIADDPVRPNVIFVLCDDLGWGDLGVLHQNESKHDKRHQTPNLDRMAAEGMQLRLHYCPAPVCAPSRASLLTGVHQGNAEVRDNQFDKMLEDNHTLATVMRGAGYRTALIGKYGLQGNGDSADNWPGYPTRRGFDEFYGYVRHVDGHVHYPADQWALGNGEKHRSPKQVWHNDDEVSSGLARCYTTDLFTARSKHFIADHVKEHPEQPFFLYLAYDTPHAALQVPATEYPSGRGLDGGVQWLGTPGKMINTAEGKIDSYRHPDYVGKGWADVEERFATMVRRIDDCMGDLLATLRDLNIDKNTLVVISSDNGPHKESYIQGASYDPTSFQSYGSLDGIKRDVWEGGIRVPTLAWWPGNIQPGSIDSRPSQFHDWMPTMAELAGVPAPARTDGVSLKPRLTGQADAPEGIVYVEYVQQGTTPKYDDFRRMHRGRKRGQQQVIHLGGYKGVRLNVKSHDDPFEIYDLVRDPGETENLALAAGTFDDLQRRMHDRVLQIRRPNASAARPYDGVPIPAIATVDTKPGLAGQFFPGQFPYVPQVAGMTPALEVTLDDFGTDQMVVPSAGVVQLSGFIQVDQTGTYTLRVKGRTKAFIRVHDAPMIDADFGYSAGEVRTAKMNLEKGLHPFRMTYSAGPNEDGDWDVSFLPEQDVRFRRP